MPTFVASRLFEIFAGTPATTADTTTLLGLGPLGDPALKRRLVHPTSATFAPVLYFQNPDRYFNIDNELLRAPIVNIVRTLENTAVTRFETFDPDVVITEVWTADESKFSMPGFMFRQLYEYLLNPPPYSATAQTFITWQPQDKNSKTYNVELLRLMVGAGGDPTQLFDVTEFHPRGQNDGGLTDPLAGLDDAFANEGSGLLDRAVTFQFKIVGEAA